MSRVKMLKLKNIKMVHFGLIAISLLFCEWFFFRNIIGNDFLIGSIVDGRYTNLVVEHWFQFLQGNESFRDQLMFYPIKGTVGYSDMLLGHGVIYCVFRLLGINMYDAYKWTLILIHLVGTYTAYYMFNKKMQFSPLLSLFGTIAFSFSQSYAYHLRHTQFFAMSWLPLLLICIINLIDKFEHRKSRNIYAYLTILMLALIAYTSWYSAFFFGFFTIVFCVSYLILILKNKELRKGLISALKSIKFDIIGYIGFLVVIFAPFFYVYLPILKEKGGYTYDYVISKLPEPIDLINVPSHNLALGSWINDSLQLTERGYSLEVIQGFSPVLLGIFIAGLVVLRRNKSNTNSKEAIYQTCRTALASAILICILITLKLSSNGISLWYLVYRFFPAGQSIRVPARFFLFLQFPMTIVAAMYCNEFVKKVKFQNIVLVILIGITFFFNISLKGVSAFWNKDERVAAMQNVSAPPEDCMAFYLIDTVNEIENGGQLQADAFEIATIYGVPTINGINGQVPEGWEKINKPGDKITYEQAVFDWVENKNLEGIYAYNIGTDEWIAIEERKEAINE